jgi:F-type H+-transporting ATPase subunit b
MLAANPLIEVAPGLMIWTLICFGLTFFVLKKVAWGPMQKAIDQRRDRIREALLQADHARDEARRLLEEHRALIAGAKGDAEEILSEARKTRDAMEERARADVEEDRQRRLEETRKQIEAETQRALEAIRAEVAELSVVAAEKVIGRALDRDDDRRLIDEAIRDLDFSKLESTRT